MTLYHEIYKLRGQLDVSRQPESENIFTSFDALLDTVGAEHPYALTGSELIHLLQEAYFRRRNSNVPARLMDEITFLYRIAPIKQVINDRGIQWHWKLDHVNENHNVWKDLQDDFKVTNDWLDLENYCGGHLLGFRKFTWWTSYSHIVGNLAAAAHKLGLVDDWLAKYLLVLRCKCTDSMTGAVFVPSCLDGFLSLIFDSKPTRLNPEAGITIDLSDIDNLREGIDEVILDPVPVTLIQFMPVLFDEQARKQGPKVELGEKLLRALVKYYYEGT
ncbi:MAG: hypothetical protein GY847_13250 [Proteobacteria bacterium]|nr:hypothetical protein [Pseudomonadota bacterium]